MLGACFIENVFKILMIRLCIYVVCRRVASCEHFTCDSLQHKSLYMWIIASTRSCCSTRYNAFNVYRRELAPGTVSLTGDRAQGDDSKHWAYSSVNAPVLVSVYVDNNGRYRSRYCKQDQVYTTVHSRYLGSKKPLGGIYHYINIGSFFLMLLDKYGIKLLHVMYFSINMSGVEDNVENYQTYLISCSTVIVFESYGILFFVLSLISRSLMIFMLN